MAGAIAPDSSPCDALSNNVLQGPLRPVNRPQSRSGRHREKPPSLRRRSLESLVDQEAAYTISPSTWLAYRPLPGGREGAGSYPVSRTAHECIQNARRGRGGGGAIGRQYAKHAKEWLRHRVPCRTGTTSTTIYCRRLPRNAAELPGFQGHQSTAQRGA
jgi:hypothetical protein